MPNIGFWATASAGGAAGSYELIQTVNGDGSSGTISFTSLPAGYKHLQIRAVVRGTRVSTDLGVYSTFNSIGGTAYSRHHLFGNGTNVQSQGFASQPSILLAEGMPGSQAAANVHGSLIVDFLDVFSTTKNKTVRTLSGMHDVGYKQVGLASGAWLSTSAVTSIQINTQVDNWTASSRFSLYGVKA